MENQFTGGYVGGTGIGRRAGAASWRAGVKIIIGSATREGQKAVETLKPSLRAEDRGDGESSGGQRADFGLSQCLMKDRPRW
jgi:hypothetical protein